MKITTSRVNVLWPDDIRLQPAEALGGGGGEKQARTSGTDLILAAGSRHRHELSEAHGQAVVCRWPPNPRRLSTSEVAEVTQRPG